MGTRGFRRFARKVRGIDRTLSRAEREIPVKAGHKGVRNIKRNLIDQDLVVSTELWRSVGSQNRGVGTTHIEVDADYAGFVEHGTGKKGDGTYKASNNVPVRAILLWMQQKPTFTIDDNPRETASYIAQSLMDEGQRQQEYFGPAWDDTVDYTRRQLIEAMIDAF